MKQARLFLFSGFLFFSQMLFAMEKSFSDKDNFCNLDQDNSWDFIEIENENFINEADTKEPESFFEALQNFIETEPAAKTSTKPVDLDENNSFELIDEKITEETKKQNPNYKPRLKDKELKNKEINYSCKAYDNSIKCNYSIENIDTFRRHLKIVHKEFTCEKIKKIIKKQNPNYKPRLKDYKPRLKDKELKNKKINYSCKKYDNSIECDYLDYSIENPSSFRNHMKNKHHLSNEKITEEMQKQNPNYKPRNPNYKPKKKTTEEKN